MDRVLNLSSMCLVSNLCRLFEALLIAAAEHKTFEELNKRMIALECLFVFALVWSVGANTGREGRSRFNGFLRHLMSGNATREDTEALEKPFEGISLRLLIPGKGSVYDYVFDVVRFRSSPDLIPIASSTSVDLSTSL
jgi:hypothetical protein